MAANRRIAGWEAAFEQAIRAAEEKKFTHGVFDCALFVSDAILAMTGIDPASEYRGQYRGRRQARRILAAFDERLLGLADAIARRHGFARIPPLTARRGDVVLVAHQDRAALGCVALDGASVLVPAPVGLTRRSLSEAQAAWRIA